MWRRRQTWAIFIVAVLFLAAGLFQYAFEGEFTAQRSGVIGYLMALGTGPTAFWLGLIPLIGSLSGGDTLAWDRRTGFLRYERTRRAVADMAFGKVIATGLSAILVAFCAMAVVFGISAALLSTRMPPWHIAPGGIPTINIAGAPTNYVEPYPVFLHSFFFSQPLLYIVLVSIVVSFAIVFWAELSLLLSVWTTNLVIVIGMPWLTYVVATFVVGGPLIGAGNWTPIALSGPFVGAGSGPPAYGIVMLWPILAILVAGGAYVAMVRKENELYE